MDLQSKVDKWLNGQGYALEFRTHNALRAQGLYTTMGFHLSNDGSTPSEIDVIAHKGTPYEGQQNPIACVRLLCECKYSKSHPWILLSTGDVGYSILDWLFIPKPDEMLTFFRTRKQLGERFFGGPYFSAKVHVGHTIVPAFRDSESRDDAYKALQKISHSAWKLATDESAKKIKLTSIVIPCIVVDTPLFVARYDPASGKIATTPIDWGRVRWHGTGTLTLVDVVSSSYLEQFSKDIARSFDEMHAVLELGLRQPD